MTFIAMPVHSRLTKRTHSLRLVMVTIACIPLSGVADEPGSPLDRLDRSVRTGREQLKELPAELVAIVGENRGRHGDAAKCVAVSPDGQLIASGSRDGTVRLWNAETLQNVATFPHGDDVDAVTFSPDGTKVLSVCWDGYVREWSVSGENNPETLRGALLGVGRPAAVFSDDRRHFAYSCRQESVGFTAAVLMSLKMEHSKRDEYWMRSNGFRNRAAGPSPQIIAGWRQVRVPEGMRSLFGISQLKTQSHAGS